MSYCVAFPQQSDPPTSTRRSTSDVDSSLFDPEAGTGRIDRSIVFHGDSPKGDVTVVAKDGLQVLSKGSLGFRELQIKNQRRKNYHQYRYNRAISSLVDPSSVRALPMLRSPYYPSVSVGEKDIGPFYNSQGSYLDKERKVAQNNFNYVGIIHGNDVITTPFGKSVSSNVHKESGGRDNSFSVFYVYDQPRGKLYKNKYRVQTAKLSKPEVVAIPVEASYHWLRKDQKPGADENKGYVFCYALDSSKVMHLRKLNFQALHNKIFHIFGAILCTCVVAVMWYLSKLSW